MRSTLVLLCKVVCVSVLIGWLISTDKLDFNTVLKVWQQPKILAFNVIFWFLGGVFFCSMRWRALVQGLNFSLSKWQALRLNLIGLFFNTVMPGAVGGDFVKALYVCKGQARQARMPVLLSILLDRVLGLLALLVLSFLSILGNWQQVMAKPVLRPFAAFTFTAIVGLAVFAFLIFAPSEKKEKWPLIRGVYQLILHISLLRQVYEALRSYKDNPVFIARACAFAFAHQALCVGLFISITQVFFPAGVEWGLLATILPIGIITTAIPLAPGGLGLGHVAFEKLFHLINLSDGANVFNVVFCGQMLLNLLGLIPYLFMRSELAPLMDAEKLSFPAEPVTLKDEALSF